MGLFLFVVGVLLLALGVLGLLHVLAITLAISVLLCIAGLICLIFGAPSVPFRR